MVRRLVLAAAGLVSLGATAFAADLPSRATPAPVGLAIPYSWSGFYVGVNAGYGFSDNRHRPLCKPACAPTPALDTDSDGFVGGGQMSEDEVARRGANRSLIHIDWMIGSAEVDVDGITADGTAEPVMRRGEWA